MPPPDEDSGAFERLWEAAHALDAESREMLADAMSLGEPLTQGQIADLMEQIDPEERAQFRDDLEAELGLGDTE
jgi:hypothetical protein